VITKRYGNGIENKHEDSVFSFRKLSLKNNLPISSRNNSKLQSTFLNQKDKNSVIQESNENLDEKESNNEQEELTENPKKGIIEQYNSIIQRVKRNNKRNSNSKYSQNLKKSQKCQNKSYIETRSKRKSKESNRPSNKKSIEKSQNSDIVKCNCCGSILNISCRIKENINYNIKRII